MNATEYMDIKSTRSPVGDKQRTRVMMNRPAAGGGRTFVEATLDSNFGVQREGTKPSEAPSADVGSSLTS